MNLVLDVVFDSFVYVLTNNLYTQGYRLRNYVSYCNIHNVISSGIRACPSFTEVLVDRYKSWLGKRL